MKLTQLPNLRVEDFPTEMNWINRLFIQLNPFNRLIYQILDNNIDFITNIKAVTKEYNISSFQAFNFLWPFKDADPNDLRIIKALKGVQQTPTILLPAWSYDKTNRLINITNILEINETYIASLSGEYKFTIRATI